MCEEARVHPPLARGEEGYHGGGGGGYLAPFLKGAWYVGSVRPQVRCSRLGAHSVSGTGENMEDATSLTQLRDGPTYARVGLGLTQIRYLAFFLIRTNTLQAGVLH